MSQRGQNNTGDQWNYLESTPKQLYDIDSIQRESFEIFLKCASTFSFQRSKYIQRAKYVHSAKFPNQHSESIVRTLFYITAEDSLTRIKIKMAITFQISQMYCSGKLDCQLTLEVINVYFTHAPTIYDGNVTRTSGKIYFICGCSSWIFDSPLRHAFQFDLPESPLHQQPKTFSQQYNHSLINTITNHDNRVRLKLFNLCMSSTSLSFLTALPITFSTFKIRSDSTERSPNDIVDKTILTFRERELNVFLAGSQSLARSGHLPGTGDAIGLTSAIFSELKSLSAGS